ncbi:hypothetical protein FB451DRAFT_211392 [Mycena latifolia]|nr:hypothetical protein FB451DRAFT_211392 [Mycena latifolia]
MGAKYLCCLPLRLGVVVISFFQFLASAGVAGILTYVLILDAQGKGSVQIPSRTRIVAIVLAAICGLVAFISLTGKLCMNDLNPADPTDQWAIDTCNASSKLSLWVLIVSAVTPILFQAYGVYIIAAYVRKLRIEESDSFVFKTPGYVQVGEGARP